MAIQAAFLCSSTSARPSYSEAPPSFLNKNISSKKDLNVWIRLFPKISGLNYWTFIKCLKVEKWFVTNCASNHSRVLDSKKMQPIGLAGFHRLPKLYVDITSSNFHILSTKSHIFKSYVWVSCWNLVTRHVVYLVAKNVVSKSSSSQIGL